MHCRLKKLAVPILFLIFASSALIASEPTEFDFQGILKNSDGLPVPSGNYDLSFSIYGDSIGGQTMWSESHQASHIEDGLFRVRLGSIVPFSLSIFNFQPLYLAVRIGSNPDLAPRMRIGTLPRAASSQRLAGDVFTMPGILKLFNPQPEPPADGPLLQMSTSFDNDVSIYMFNPQPEPPAHPAFSISNNPAGGPTIKFFNPQPEPPANNPLMTLQTGLGGSASIRMFNPQPEPPAKIMGLESSLAGGELTFMAPQAGGMALVNRNPQIRLKCDSTASRFTLQRARSFLNGDDSTGISINADSLESQMDFYNRNDLQLRIHSNSDGTAMHFFDDGSERMGIEPSPFNPGMDLKFYNDLNEEVIRMSSTGAASFFDDGSERMGIEPSPFNPGVDLKFYNDLNEEVIRLSSNGAASFLDGGEERMGVEPSPFLVGGYDLKMYNASGGGTLILTSSGEIGIGTASTPNILTVKEFSATDPIADAWTTYSSRRWKTNIQPMQGALDKVMRLNGVTFDWKENGKHDIGLIAEEVGQVVPEVVAYEDNGVDAKSVDYARLTALLIEAVKEQQKTIDELKSEINDIKAQSNKDVSLEEGK